MLEKFARLIQSGRNVYLDNKTLITIHTFSAPTGGTLMYSSDKEEFLKTCKSIVKVENPNDQTCYCLCFALAIAQREAKNGDKERTKTEYFKLINAAKVRWREAAKTLHTSLGVSIHTKLTQDLMAVTC